MPFQVWRDPEDVLVVDLVPAAHAQRHQPLLWKHTSTSMPGHKLMTSSSWKLHPWAKIFVYSDKKRAQILLIVVVIIIIVIIINLTIIIIVLVVVVV